MSLSPTSSVWPTSWTSNVEGASGGVGPVKLGEFDMDAQIPVGKDKGAARAVIRPECVVLEEGDATGGNRIPGMIERTVFLGSTSQVMVRLAQGSLIQALVTNAVNEEPWASGDAVRVQLPADSLRVLESSATAAWADGQEKSSELADAV